jgi:Lar family restriction alleviation protein
MSKHWYTRKKPCPFCGGTKLKNYKTRCRKMPIYGVVCSTCLSEGKFTIDGKEQAILNWNKRK